MQQARNKSQRSTRPPAARSPRLAAIDIGTNSIRCIVVEAEAQNGFRVLDDEKATVRLGEGLATSGRISAEAIERARQALRRMVRIADGLGVEHVEAVATSAVRKATNGAEFIATMRAETGLDIAVIDGRREAELATLSALHHFDMNNSRYVLIDIGGGSIEVVSAIGAHVEEIDSLELGAVFLTETFLNREPIPKDDMRRLRKHLRQELRRILGEPEFAPQCLIGSGGTVTNIASMVMARRGEQYDRLQAYDVLHSEVVHLLAMLERTSLRERRAIDGLSTERADIIVAGVTAIDALLRHYGANHLRVNAGGIREGLIIQSLKKYGLWTLETDRRDWLAAVTAFARACQADELHAEQVRRLAVAIFEAVPPATDLDQRARMMLEAAALLHDVGYFIGYSKHHKHSCHLIRHADLYDFSPRETEIIANLARYHRKSLPKSRHENFARLGSDDQKLVRKLAGILRLADGLDRRRGSAVRDISCYSTSGRFVIELAGSDDLSVEIYGARTKGDLFETAFGQTLDFKALPSL
ncbi:MAG: Ppx/GppA phosphatase family protein [Desulfuromonadales bacterium]|nr:Ppx/GppA phosphatase family protein [Desulfuromonadales bacterium]